jgi:pimeloyl-ACP methyl ester carboxylesterase
MNRIYEILPEVIPHGPWREKPIICVHGTWSDARCFERFLEYFRSHGYDIRAFSFRGNGKSSRPKRFHRTRLKDYVEDLEEVIKLLGFEKPILIGWSLGGLIVQKYLERHPEHDTPTVLLATVPPRGVFFVTVRYAVRHLGTYARMFFPPSMSPVVDDPEKVAEMLLTPQNPDRMALAKELSPLMQDTSFRAYAEMNFPFVDPRRIHSPLLVLWAEDDALMQEGERKNLSKRLPHAETEVVLGIGHGMIFDVKWKEVAERGRIWIEK